jgi:uncharacterized protein YbbC (DUF1343 family)
VRPGYESFVSAFHTPVRHGLTAGELTRLESIRRGWSGREEGLAVWKVEGWERGETWPEGGHRRGRPWIAPSPNMPTPATAHLYPGSCLIEATQVSEGRGTTRPFHLVGAPGVDPPALAGRFAERLAREGLRGVTAVPTYFRPQFQKHAGAECGGIELVVTDREALRPYRVGIHLLLALREVAPEAFGWRDEPYEFVIDRPAIDLLTGSDVFRERLEAGEDPTPWMDSWAAEEEAFREERRPALIYPEAPSEVGTDPGIAGRVL